MSVIHEASDLSDEEKLAILGLAGQVNQTLRESTRYQSSVQAATSIAEVECDVSQLDVDPVVHDHLEQEGFVSDSD